MQEVGSESYSPSENFEFDLSGGALCLDFVNTLGDRPRKQAEHLHTYGDVLAWSQQTGVLEESDVKRLASVAQEDPSAALTAFTRARALREDLYRVISALPLGQAVPSGEFDSLNKQIRQLMSESELIPDESGFRLERNGAADALDQMLWSVLRSAVELLTSERVRDIRQCEGENCSWLFIDNSRTRRKKWCDMQVCGNRAKARRHYKKKAAQSN
jgi:predicted RNA-binding Zn ribbon-like protein